MAAAPPLIPGDAIRRSDVREGHMYHWAFHAQLKRLGYIGDLSGGPVA